jgi:hypothetical protein
MKSAPQVGAERGAVADGNGKQTGDEAQDRSQKNAPGPSDALYLALGGDARGRADAHRSGLIASPYTSVARVWRGVKWRVGVV